MSRFVVAGTDTGIGKTVFAAALSNALGGTYWKPIQSGLDEIDSETVGRLSAARILPEAYRLKQPLSPHRSAEIEEVAIDLDRLRLPGVDGPLVIEMAGGLLVPVTREILFVDLLAGWGLPVVLCARTGLGTINHTLLSVEALKSRNVALHGIAFIGEDNPDNIRTICDFSGARGLGRLPPVEPLTGETLSAAFRTHFDTDDFDE